MKQEEVMKILTDMGLHEGGMENWVVDNAWWRFANVVERQEREACAKVCEHEWSNAAERDFGEQCAAIIRGREARGQA